MAKVSGLVLPELLERHEKHLTDMLLISPRLQVMGDMQHGHASGINSSNNRLTQLGFRFCKNIETYEIERKDAQARRSGKT